MARLNFAIQGHDVTRATISNNNREIPRLEINLKYLRTCKSCSKKDTSKTQRETLFTSFSRRE